MALTCSRRAHVLNFVLVAVALVAVALILIGLFNGFSCKSRMVLPETRVLTPAETTSKMEHLEKVVAATTQQVSRLSAVEGAETQKQEFREKLLTTAVKDRTTRSLALGATKPEEAMERLYRFADLEQARLLALSIHRRDGFENQKEELELLARVDEGCLRELAMDPDQWVRIVAEEALARRDPVTARKVACEALAQAEIAQADSAAARTVSLATAKRVDVLSAESQKQKDRLDALDLEISDLRTEVSAKRAELATLKASYNGTDWKAYNKIEELRADIVRLQARLATVEARKPVRVSGAFNAVKVDSK